MNLVFGSRQILEALLNGGLQGLLLTVLVAAVLRLHPRLNAATRHAICFVNLLVVAALPILHFALGSASAPVSAAFSEVRAGPLPAATETLGTSPRIEPLPAAIPELSEDSIFEVSQPRLDVQVGQPSTVDRVGRRWSFELPGLGAVALVAVWLAVSACRLGSLTWDCVRLRLLKRCATTADGPTALRFLQILREMQVSRRVKLGMGPSDGVPLLVGFRHPLVLIPEGFPQAHPGEPVAQVLRHELAHLQRGDDWANLIQQVIRAILFFHPAVWWVSERLSLDREIACDDHVLAATQQTRGYALLLTDFAGRHRERDLIAAPAAWNRKTQLKERIAMILNSNRNASPRMAGTWTGLLVMVIAGFTGILVQATPRVALGLDDAGTDTPELGGTGVSETRSGNDPVSASADPFSAPSGGPSTLMGPAAGETSLLSAPVVLPLPARSLRGNAIPAELPTGSDVVRRETSETLPREGDGGLGQSVLEQRLDRLERLMEKLEAQRPSALVSFPRSEKRKADQEILVQLSEQKPRSIAKTRRANPDLVAPQGIQGTLKGTTETVHQDPAVFDQLRRHAEQSQKEMQELQHRDWVETVIRNEPYNRLNLEEQRRSLETARRSLEKDLKKIEQQLRQLDEVRVSVEKSFERSTKEELKLPPAALSEPNLRAVPPNVPGTSE